MKLKPKNTTLNQRALVYRRYTQLADSETYNTVYKTTNNKYWLFSTIEMGFIEINAQDVPANATIINITANQVYKYKTQCFLYSRGRWETFISTPQREFKVNEKLVDYYAALTDYWTRKPIYIGVKGGTGHISLTNNSTEQMTIILNVQDVESGTISTIWSSNINPGVTVSPIGYNMSADKILLNMEIYCEESVEAKIVMEIFDYELFDFSQVLPTIFPQIASIAKYQKNAYYYAGSFSFMLRGSVSGSTSQYIKGNIVPLTSMNIKYFDDSLDLQVDDLVVVDGKLYSVENPETDFKFQPKGYKIHFVTLNNIL